MHIQAFARCAGEYVVVGVTTEQYDARQPESALTGLLRVADPVVERAFRSYLGVAATPPDAHFFAGFATKVNEFLERPPFSYPNAGRIIGIHKQVRVEAAYLYDAAHLYARALVEQLDAGGDPLNGTEIINRLRNCSYFSAMG
ncbi:Guanylate cyclase 32E-like Protein [Gryllus bimaculatus]|nr:Guanylate cyclase 32E-like Protein [Gryllus bimaculatus]